MTTLDYPHHFVLLVGATAVLALGLLVQPPWAPVADRLFVLFGLSGALHAVTVVRAVALCIADRRHALASSRA
jgi:hypothetical protein